MDLRTFLTGVGVVALCFFGIPMRIDDKKLGEHKLKFKSFTQQYNKDYVTDQDEYDMRFEQFQNSLKKIEELNSQRMDNNSAYYGLTEFSDLSQEEFILHKLHPMLARRVRQHPGHFVSATFRNHHHNRNHLHNRLKKRAVKADLPQKMDWREKGAVTPVNNQKTCGACWAFSTVQTVESMNFLKTGQLQKLSIQQAIDCARNGNMGCDGGDTCSLIIWLAENKIKLQPENAYPLMLETQACKLKKSTIGVQVATNYTCDYLVGDEDTLLSLLAYHGPVAVAVNALSWQYYLGGVIQFHCDGSLQNLNHAVQIIGYDLTAPIPHYIVRNSWGTAFGDQGYMYLAIGTNICGLATEVTGLDVL